MINFTNIIKIYSAVSLYSSSDSLNNCEMSSSVSFLPFVITGENEKFWILNRHSIEVIIIMMKSTTKLLERKYSVLLGGTSPWRYYISCNTFCFRIALQGCLYSRLVKQRQCLPLGPRLGRISCIPLYKTGNCITYNTYLLCG